MTAPATTTAEPSPPSLDRGRAFAWCSYDWAAQPFATVISTFVFARYFVDGVAADPAEGQTMWGLANGFASLFIALASPAMGAIADQTGRRKPWILVLSLLCIVCTALLWFATPASGEPGNRTAGAIAWALVPFVLGTIAIELATVFYNAMLPAIVPPRWLGRISGWAWGLGYAGGVICLALALALVLPKEPPFGLDKGQAEHIRAVTLLSALWFLIFAWPLFAFVPDVPAKTVRLWNAVRDGFRQLGHTFAQARRHRAIFRFLIARLFYIDGLNTLFAFGGIYAGTVIGMTTEEVIMLGIGLNVTAGLGAFAFGWVDDALGSKRTVVISLSGMIVLSTAILLVQDKWVFFGIAMALAVFMGPTQAASRTLMARLAPAELRNEMFGLFALSGRVTAFLGPWVLAGVTAATGNQTLGMATILVFLIVGLVILRGVEDAR